ncbi:MAG: nitronate monooxygenase [Chloroflexi bacterium]|nr:nitronate monooxygenase [Chloroflexota bacterium]
MQKTKNPLETPFTKEFGLQYPIVSFGHCKDVIVEICKAGGMGVYGVAGFSPEEIDRELTWIEERVEGKPFGVDVIVSGSMPATGTTEEFEAQIPQAHWDWIEKLRKEFNIPNTRLPDGTVINGRVREPRGAFTQEYARAQLEVLLEHRVPLFACAQGNPAFIIPEMHHRGVKVLGLIGLVRQAVREHAAGIDYIVAHGQDGGGHCGPIGTFTLTPQVARAVAPTPVLAAGGVGCGRQVAAALMLGAAGVWTGTAWLTAKEHDIEPIAQAKILAARSEDTVRTNWGDGAFRRHVGSRMDERWVSKDAPPILPRPMQGILNREIMYQIADNKVEDVYYGMGCGQTAGLLTEVKPARQIMDEWVNECLEAFEQYGLLT